jgi:DNA-binding transcriptional ArsR family regulator
MPIDQFEPVNHMVLRNSEAIAAYANPTRIAILSILAEQEATLTMIASRIGTAPANLSHHIRTLLGSRLIALVETRASLRNVEKFYRASAYSYSIAFDGSEGSDDRAAALASFREELSAAVSRRIRIDRPGLDADTFSAFRMMRIKAMDAASFRARLEELAREFAAKGCEDGEPYALGLALFHSGSGAP